MFDSGKTHFRLTFDAAYPLEKERRYTLLQSDTMMLKSAIRLVKIKKE